MVSIYLIEKYAYGTGQYLVSEKEGIKDNNIAKRDENSLTVKSLRKKA